MFKPIPGYETLYEIDASGTVRRLTAAGGRRVVKPLVNKFNQGVRVRLCRSARDHRRFLVHRLVWSAFVGPIPDGLTINHIDGSRLNNHLSNLELATMREQMLHAYATGLQKIQRGEARGHVAKLKNEQVARIKRLYASGHRVESIASDHNVSMSAVYKILQGQRWSHIV